MFLYSSYWLLYPEGICGSYLLRVCVLFYFLIVFQVFQQLIHVFGTNLRVLLLCIVVVVGGCLLLLFLLYVNAANM